MNAKANVAYKVKADCVSGNVVVTILDGRISVQRADSVARKVFGGKMKLNSRNKVDADEVRSYERVSV